jgi:hypothetical protein
MFIQDENNELLKQQISQHKHFYIVIKKNNLKFYLSFSDNSFRRRKKSFDSLYDMEGSDFKLDFKFGYHEKTYESLQQFHDDFKEVRTDLIPSKDLLVEIKIQIQHLWPQKIPNRLVFVFKRIFISLATRSNGS